MQGLSAGVKLMTHDAPGVVQRRGEEDSGGETFLMELVSLAIIACTLIFTYGHMSAMIITWFA